jgi:hypothetical protein
VNWHSEGVTLACGNDQEEDLAKFGYKLFMKAILKKYLDVFGYLLEPCIEIWQNFLNIDQIMATENIRQYLILALKNFV